MHNCMHVSVRQVYTLACADSVMCLLIGRGWSSLLGAVHGACQLLSLSYQPPPPPLTHPISHTPPAKQRQPQPQQLHPKGPSLHEYLTSATASFCFTHFPLLCYLSLSRSLSSSSSSSSTLSSKHFWLFCFGALQELLLMTTITVVYFLSAAQPLCARRATITL